MRICFLTKNTLAHAAGGMQVHADYLVRLLSGMGHELTVLTTSLAGPPREPVFPGAEHHYLDGTEPAVYSRSWWRVSRKEFCRLDAQKKFDLVIGIDSALAFLGPMPGLPRISFYQGFGPEHLYNQWQEIRSPVDFCRYLCIKVPETLLYGWWIEGMAVHESDLVVYSSRRIIRLQSRWRRIPMEKFELLLNWVDEKEFRPDADRRERARRELGFASDDTVVLCWGVVGRQKGFDVAVEAFDIARRASPSLKLLLGGSGPARPEIERLIAERGLQRFVAWAPSTGRADAARWYNASDMFIMPTRRLESITFVSVEASLSGLPLVLSDRGANREQIEQNVDGILVPEPDPALFAEEIMRLVRDSALRARLGSRARERALRDHSIDAARNRLEQILSRATAIACIRRSPEERVSPTQP